jgi:hypothetical protein
VGVAVITFVEVEVLDVVDASKADALYIHLIHYWSGSSMGIVTSRST